MNLGKQGQSKKKSTTKKQGQRGAYSKGKNKGKKK